eukprot:6922752-Prymnesium_polylepis.1
MAKRAASWSVESSHSRVGVRASSGESAVGDALTTLARASHHASSCFTPRTTVDGPRSFTARAPSSSEISRAKSIERLAACSWESTPPPTVGLTSSSKASGEMESCASAGGSFSGAVGRIGGGENCAAAAAMLAAILAAMPGIAVVIIAGIAMPLIGSVMPIACCIAAIVGIAAIACCIAAACCIATAGGGGGGGSGGGGGAGRSGPRGYRGHRLGPVGAVLQLVQDELLRVRCCVHVADQVDLAYVGAVLLADLHATAGGRLHTLDVFAALADDYSHLVVGHLKFLAPRGHIVREIVVHPSAWDERGPFVDARLLAVGDLGDHLERSRHRLVRAHHIDGARIVLRLLDPDLRAGYLLELFDSQALGAYDRADDRIGKLQRLRVLGGWQRRGQPRRRREHFRPRRTTS